MTIVVNASNVQTGRPQEVFLQDRSGAHTELTLLIEGQAPIATAFAYHDGDYRAPIDLAPGQYRCRLYVQAYHYADNHTLNPMYDVRCVINGQRCAAARGSIPVNGSDAGANDFVLAVV